MQSVELLAPLGIDDQARPPSITEDRDQATLVEAAGVEAARMAAVRRYDILDTEPDEAFERIAGLAARWLDAPVATVSIVDADRIWFTAAYGLGGVREIGRGPGLCASAIGQDEALVIGDTLADPVARHNPLVAGDLAVRFYAAAPLITADGHRLGTVNVLDTRPRQITPAEVRTLEDLAAVVMNKLELRLSALQTLRREQQLRAQIQRDLGELTEFASTLQQTLLPPALPVIPGLELACHYHTASPRDVGGDFYDVFALGPGRWAFFLGDVCGKGASAATMTSLIRYTLRSAALHDPDPVAVLGELNDAMVLDTPVGRFCTAMFGTIIPDPTHSGGFTIRLGNGGHPAAIALRASPDRQTGELADELGTGHLVTELIEPGGMLIGAFPDATFAATTVHLGPGDGLLLYSDGLIEAYPDGTDILGEHGLAEQLTRLSNRPTEPSLNAHQLINDTVTLLAGFTHGSDDDTALLAMTVPTQPVPPS